MAESPNEIQPFCCCLSLNLFLSGVSTDNNTHDFEVKDKKAY